MTQSDLTDAETEAPSVSSEQIQSWFERANELSSKQEWAESVEYHRKVLDASPNHEWALNNMGFCLTQQGKHDEAILCLRKCAGLAPRNDMAHANLVAAMEAAEQRFEAIPFRRRMVELRPEVAEHSFALANSLLACGRVREAVFYYRRTIDNAPTHMAAICNYLLALNYSDRETEDSVAIEHFRLAQRWGARRRAPHEFPQSRDPDRRLRIGYLSGDFANHPVGKIMLPLIAAHDQTGYEVFAYSDRHDEDPWTKAIREKCTSFVTSVDLSDEELEKQILEHEIDVLVELTGYTGGRNRLGVFARGCAPLQAAFLGYPNTTGTAAMDLRITDRFCDRPGHTEQLHSEKLIRMRSGFLCYQPPDELPLPTVAPFRKSRRLTFGSFNNPSKISESALLAWAQILQQVPDSVIRVKYGGSYASEALKERWRERFAGQGVATERIQFLPAAPSIAEHLRLIGEVDLALDSFPYQGTMTTLETLSMGVPVITLAGQTYSRRASSALLLRLGYDELVTDSSEAYVAQAVRLARNTHRLEQIRSELRERFLASEICDPAGYAQELQAVYRQQWRQWCRRNPGQRAEA